MIEFLGFPNLGSRMFWLDFVQSILEGYELHRGLPHNVHCAFLQPRCRKKTLMNGSIIRIF
jgi:hypothetical protein